MLKRICMALCCLAALLTAAGCDFNARYEPDKSIIASQSYKPETVYIGSVLPFTSYGDTAENMRAAMEVAADIINNSHQLDWALAQNEGIAGYGNSKIELLFRDCGEFGSQTAEMADELLDMGVIGILGAYDSNYTATTAIRSYVKKRPLITGAAKDFELTDADSYSFAPYFNRIAAIDGLESELFFQYLKHLNQTQNAEIKKIAIAYIDNEYGRHALGSFNEFAEQYGFEVVARILYESDIESVAVEASRMIANQPDALFHVSSVADLSLFAEAYTAAQYEPKIVLCYSGGFQQKDFLDKIAELGENRYAGIMTCPSTTQQMNKAEELRTQEIFAYINRLYYQKTRQNMSNSALLEFAAVIVMAEAVGMAGTTDSETLANIIKERVFDAPFLPGGSIDFDESGQNIVMPGYVAQIIDGEYTKVFPL